MFDRLDWWQILVLLAPIALVMAWIRRREALAQGIDLGRLTRGQKGWIMLTLLPPGLAAATLCDLTDQERSGYLKSGRLIRGSRRSVATPLLREFLLLTAPGTRVKSSDPAELLDQVVARCDRDPALLMRTLREHYPAPKPEEIVEPVIRTIETPEEVEAQS